ncbi:MAG: hypothetical protein U0361_21505 [Nitrospiraceae bacterium]
MASQAINEFQKENNQYGHMVWRHDVNASNFFSLAGYMRHTRATFKTDPLNVLAYTADPAEPFRPRIKIVTPILRAFASTTPMSIARST